MVILAQHDVAGAAGGAAGTAGAGVSAVLVVASFLAGSVPFSLLVGLAKGVDIRTIGSGNVGATNLGRALGKKYFFVGFLLDMLKGFVPVLVAGRVLGTLGVVQPALAPTLVWLGCALGAVLGHVFSPWLRFKGGKGVATGLGVMLALYPVMTLASAVALVVFLLCMALSRYMSLSSMLAGLALTPGAVLAMVLLRRHVPAADALRGVWSGSSLAFVLCACVLGVLVVITHRANIGRLRAGKEPKFGTRVTTPK